MRLTTSAPKPFCKPKLLLIRGLPGSGKTTKAQALADYTLVEANQFFMKNGRYQFAPELLSRAHEWCQRRTKEILQEGRNVVVANTFVKVFEMEYYLELAIDLGCDIEIQTAKGSYPNIHGVPKETVAKMRRNWEVFSL